MVKKAASNLASGALAGGKKAAGCCLGVCGSFRDFILRGDVVSLAVAVVVGTAFTVLVNAFVSDFLLPLIGIIWQAGTFNEQYFSINGSHFLYGHFLEALITFVLVCIVVFFAVVLPTTHLYNRIYGPPKALRDCPDCLSEVPALATKCKFCCVALVPTATGDGTRDGEGGGKDTSNQDEIIQKAQHSQAQAQAADGAWELGPDGLPLSKGPVSAAKV